MKNSTGLFFCSLALLTSSVNAAVVTAQTGQSFSFTNAFNQTFNITYVGSTGRITYTPGAWFEPDDAYTIQGFMSWLNVTKTEFLSNGPTVINFTYLEDPYGEIYRSSARIQAPGNFVKIDNTAGKIVSAGGLNAATMQAPRFPGGLTGGKIEIKNIEAKFDTPTMAADADGLSLPVGTRPSASYTIRGTDFWTYEAITGPAPFPQAMLTRNNIQQQLKNAGYFIRSVTNERITFFGVYKMSRLRFTPEALNLYLKSFGYLSSWTLGIKNLNQDEPMGLGDMEVSVMLSMPLPAN